MRRPKNGSNKSTYLYRALASFVLFSLMFRFQTTQNIEYHSKQHRNTTPSQQEVSNTTTLLDWSSLRIAIYLTTHLSDQHLLALQKCWPPMVSKSRMLQRSDIFLYASGQPDQKFLEKAFHQTGGVVHTVVYQNPGYHKGAILPVEAAIQNNQKWFSDYDWIIRINPDVLILNDTAFYSYMMNPDIDAILVNCKDETDIKLHTDFFAVRPRALPKTVVPYRHAKAERHFTKQLQHVLDSKRYVWLPDSNHPKPWECRVFGNTIVHKHRWLKNCTNLF